MSARAQSGSGGAPGSVRERQLAYSELQSEMLDEPGRRRKAAKIAAVLGDFLGSRGVTGLTVLDIGCSTGFIADELRRAGATVVGVDIDVPGLSRAAQRFAPAVHFVCADGETLPLPDASIDVVIFNHIYEHVVDADAVMADIRRVLKPQGVVYLGLGNRLGIVEPHYKLPFLSWLPKRWADRYVRSSGRADHYYETFRTRPNLIRMCRGLTVWDYTLTVLADPDQFAADDMVPGPLKRAPLALWHAVRPIMPTFIWLGTPGDAQPARGTRRRAPHVVARSSG